MHKLTFPVRFDDKLVVSALIWNHIPVVIRFFLVTNVCPCSRVTRITIAFGLEVVKVVECVMAFSCSTVLNESATLLLLLLVCLCVCGVCACIVALDELSGSVGERGPLTYEDLVKNYVVSLLFISCDSHMNHIM